MHLQKLKPVIVMDFFGWTFSFKNLHFQNQPEFTNGLTVQCTSTSTPIMAYTVFHEEKLPPVIKYFYFILIT